MKPKQHNLFFVVIALLICMGFFIFPHMAYAKGEGEDLYYEEYEYIPTPPTPFIRIIPISPRIYAEIQGNLLIANTVTGSYPIESIYVNDRRFTHGYGETLALDIRQYAVAGESISVYAVDTQGTRSDIVLLAPPPPPNVITPDGQGVVVDHLHGYDGIEMFTISSRAGNIFYLIIDHAREDNNVYFLHTVSDWDLMALAYTADLPQPPTTPRQPQEIPPANEPVIYTPPPNIVFQHEEPEPSQEDAPPARSGMSQNIILLIGILIVGGGVLFVRLVVMKPKKDYFNEETIEDDDDDDFGDGFMDDEDEGNDYDDEQ